MLGRNFPVYQCETLIIGTGCAGYNAADTLYDLGCRDILMVTEGIQMGTSRNTGSDKQTYYKLSIQSDQEDNVRKMAETLFAGKCVNGDTAFAEAVNSIRCFMKLVNLGVPFPTNEYGEFVGYQTDHAREKRATSAGPLTSKYMTEALEKEVKKKGISIADKILIVELVKNEQGILGAIGIDRTRLLEEHAGITFFVADNVIMATGGPASVYKNTVYPPSQKGMSGLAISLGAECANLQEWQYGIASVDFRWNLSGTYQQVLPRYLSIDEDGQEHEFLNDYFENPLDALNFVFQKGYQWPFDSAKLNGSTVIDLLVYHEEIDLKRKVYLDFRKDPLGLENGLEGLSEEAYEYLKKSDALVETPIKRLEKMNPKAIALYQSHQIDLYKEPLRITVAAQHHNGGIAVDKNWESSVPGLYVVGEAAGNFGVYRPGGSALNACQVGALRAAEHISQKKRKTERSSGEVVKRSEFCREDFLRKLLSKSMQNDSEKTDAAKALCKIKRELTGEMSACGAQLRNRKQLESLLQKNTVSIQKIDALAEKIGYLSIPLWCKTRNMVITQKALIESMLFSAKYVGSRGGYLCIEENLDFQNSVTVMNTEIWQDTSYDNQILYYQKESGCRFENVRKLPITETWFEKVWKDYDDRMKGRPI